MNRANVACAFASIRSRSDGDSLQIVGSCHVPEASTPCVWRTLSGRTQSVCGGGVVPWRVHAAARVRVDGRRVRSRPISSDLRRSPPTRLHVEDLCVRNPARDRVVPYGDASTVQQTQHAPLRNATHATSSAGWWMRWSGSGGGARLHTREAELVVGDRVVADPVKADVSARARPAGRLRGQPVIKIRRSSGRNQVAITALSRLRRCACSASFLRKMTPHSRSGYHAQ